MSRLRMVVLGAMCLSALPGQRPAAVDAADSRIWIGRYEEIEEQLRTAECVSLTRLGNGTTLRCTLPPGGPVARMAWRSLPPGTHRGFRESYKTEIAAYELDKLLKLDMVPPTVHRQLQGTEGAAQLWVDNVVDHTSKQSPGDSHRTAWDAQIVRMIMFDNLIGNRERNLANMLRDPAWHLVLIDHSRAFGAGSELFHKMTRIDGDCWAAMEALTRARLDAALRASLDEGQIQAILDRRDRMRAEIKSLPRQ